MCYKLRSKVKKEEEEEEEYQKKWTGNKKSSWTKVIVMIEKMIQNSGNRMDKKLTQI